MSVPLPEITVDVPLLAEALATMGTVPEIPEAHCTVTVLGPVETTVAIVCGGFVGLATIKLPEYGD